MKLKITTTTTNETSVELPEYFAIRTNSDSPFPTDWHCRSIPEFEDSSELILAVKVDASGVKKPMAVELLYPGFFSTQGQIELIELSEKEFVNNFNIALEYLKILSTLKND